MRTIRKRRLDEKPSKCLQQGPNPGECLSDCHLNKQRLINSLGAEVNESVGLLDSTHAALPYKISRILPGSLYVPPTVATSQEQADEIKRILAQADAVPSGGSQRSFTELYLEAQAVADFKPIMVLSTRQGWTYRLIHGQVRADHDKYLAITSAIVDTL